MAMQLTVSSEEEKMGKATIASILVIVAVVGFIISSNGINILELMTLVLIAIAVMLFIIIKKNKLIQF